MLSQKLNSGQPWPLNQVQGPEQFTGILLRYYFPVIEIKGYAMIEKIKLGAIIILFSVIMSPLSVLGQSHGNHADHGDTATRIWVQRLAALTWQSSVEWSV
ncbi:MAG: hypothetical protein CM1200mP40_09660 [Gammaproteobacteria bacterium]|nr:MAG: hypothetical protein CM1200mP40_09660 [Gammaproteobacteria bacterium]